MFTFSQERYTGNLALFMSKSALKCKMLYVENT